jgi:glycosyltransferase involved in cell wall biosynthesis
VHNLRVLIVSQYFWPENFRVNDIAKTLFDKGVEVEVLTGKPNYPGGKKYDGYKTWGCQREVYKGININRVPLVARGNGRFQLALNYLSFVVSGLMFAPWMLRNKQFDVIFISAPSPIIQAIPALFLGWLKHCPVVLWVQDLWPESLEATGHVRNKLILKQVELIVRFIYRLTDLLLVSSKAFEIPVRHLASNTQVVYYPNSVDDTFAISVKGAIPLIQGLDQGFTILFAGNIGKAQAVGVILEAASILKEYPEIQIVVMGDGNSRDWMLQEVQRRELVNIHLPGRFSVEAMPGFMQQASALLVTLADQPIFAATVPNKIQAYMAAGRPIIACMNGEGARLVMEAQAGIATPAEAPEALANTILQLYRLTNAERVNMGINGRAYYKKHFDHELLINQLIDHLQAVTRTGDHIK